MRKKIIAGNWKMNKTLSEARALCTEIQAGLAGGIPDNTISILCVPAMYLLPVQEQITGTSGLFVGAQNAAAYTDGAFTGEISASQLAAASVPYVIIGHSERRSLFGETDEVIKTKIDLALAAGVTPIFCCGEPKEIREAGTHEALVHTQVEKAILHLDPEAIKKVVIAYEPVWAIGTGLTASSQQAQDMHAFIRSLLLNVYGKETAESVSILYGGSVKSSNAKELFDMPDVDGGLVGGASLQADEFMRIIQCA
jgi:triosephosphate isomerase